MESVRRWWRRAFDVREGEAARTICMSLYFFFSLSAVYVLKTVATSLFLDRLPDVEDRLPYLYLLVAIVGGLVAYLYTKLALRVSLFAAVAGSTLVMLLCLVPLWFWSGDASIWALYSFAVWSHLLATVFVSQGWLIAANLFDGREAKRLYALLGLGAILGGVAGGGMAATAAEKAGTKYLLPLGGVLIVLAFAALAGVALTEGRRTGVGVGERFRRRTGDDETTTEFTIREVIGAVGRHQHLMVIFGIIFVTYLVEVLVEYQFSLFAKNSYSRDELTAFLGTFNGVYVNIATFVLQFFFTSLLLGRFGVGRTLLLAPITIGSAALFSVAAQSLFSAALTRLLEASGRYSISKTAIELLYLPLPAELKNRTKAFVDMFADRFAKGTAALLLVGLTNIGWTGPWQLSSTIVVLAALWLLLAQRARQEYMDTVRRRVESRRLDLEDARVSVQDTETVSLLEQVARGSNPRQVLYALSLLSEAPGYDLSPLLHELAGSESQVIRAKVYELAHRSKVFGLADRAVEEFHRTGPISVDLVREAAAYAIQQSPDPAQLGAELIDHPNCAVGNAVLLALAGQRESVHSIISLHWLTDAAASPAAERRALAALAVGARGDEGTDVLHRLLADEDRRVVEASCRAAGQLRNKDYVSKVIPHLADARLRGTVLEALAAFGPSICEFLGEELANGSQSWAIRRQIPRVLAVITHQSSVDVLRRFIGEPDLSVRAAVLKALSRLREQAPDLDYGTKDLREQIREEAHSYFELYAALSRFREADPGGKATALLARTIDDRLHQTIERLFRLLGLRYPPKQIQAAYLAVSHKRSDEFAAALEFLDSILESDLKDILLPLIDGSPHLLDIGREHFGIARPSLEAAIRQQVRLQDTWMAACAVAAAGELRLAALRQDIRMLAESGDPVVAPVAREAIAALA